LRSIYPRSGGTLAYNGLPLKAGRVFKATQINLCFKAEERKEERKATQPCLLLAAVSCCYLLE